LILCKSDWDVAKAKCTLHCGPLHPNALENANKFTAKIMSSINDVIVVVLGPNYSSR